MAYQGQTFARNIAPYGETPYTQEDLDAAEKKKEKQAVVVDASNPYAQTYKELSGEERPKVEEAAAGKNISGRYFPQNVLDQEVLNKQNAAKKQEMIMQLRAAGVSSEAAGKMADDHIQIDNQAKQLGFKEAMLKAEDAKAKLKDHEDNLTNQAQLTEMDQAINSLNPAATRDYTDKLTAVDHKYRNLALSRNPEIAKKAQDILTKAYELGNAHRNSVAADVARFGANVPYYNEDGTLNYQETAKWGQIDTQQRTAEELAAKVKEAGAVQEAKTNVMEEARQKDIQLRADLARQAAAEKEAAKASLKNSIEGQYGKPAATLFTGVWGKEPGSYGSVKIKDDPNNPDIVLVSHPSISKGKPLPIKRSDWEAQQSSGGKTPATETTEDTKKSEKTLTDDELVAKYK